MKPSCRRPALIYVLTMMSTEYHETIEAASIRENLFHVDLVGRADPAKLFKTSWWSGSTIIEWYPGHLLPKGCPKPLLILWPLVDYPLHNNLVVLHPHLTKTSLRTWKPWFSTVFGIPSIIPHYLNLPANVRWQSLITSMLLTWPLQPKENLPNNVLSVVLTPQFINLETMKR